MKATYDANIVAWSNEQARLILAEREAATERGEERFEDWDVVKTFLRKSIENKHD